MKFEVTSDLAGHNTLWYSFVSEGAPQESDITRMMREDGSMEEFGAENATDIARAMEFLGSQQFARSVTLDFGVIVEKVPQ